MPVSPLIAFLSALSVAIHAIGAAFDGLAAGLAAMPDDEHEHEPAPTPPPSPVIPAPPAATEGETYASLRARGGAQVFGPGGEIGAAFVFSGGGWSPGV